MKRINHFYLVGVISAIILLFGLFTNNIRGTDKIELEGEWVSTVPGQDMIFIFSGENFSIKSPNVPNYWYKGTFSLKIKTDHRKIDLAIKEGGIPQYVGKTSLGIYKIENGVLIMALNQPGALAYPASFLNTGNAILFKLKKK
jgi:uncharacterized protein (TIGR03067 family)